MVYELQDQALDYFIIRMKNNEDLFYRTKLIITYLTTKSEQYWKVVQMEQYLQVSFLSRYNLRNFLKTLDYYNIINLEKTITYPRLYVKPAKYFDLVKEAINKIQEEKNIKNAERVNEGMEQLSEGEHKNDEVAP
jgi:hypothetical protein